MANRDKNGYFITSNEIAVLICLWRKKCGGERGGFFTFLFYWSRTRLETHIYIP